MMSAHGACPNASFYPSRASNNTITTINQLGFDKGYS
jgi:hypothetical protein